ncbi:hypothetical protein HFO97_26950 [Rhizobium leguminosarum]|uniref:hypothetical protein n=1 Tax=Rhizobium leguminosarum TaxID=384 RepID=UPI001C97D892|nr:hypothetical protein [Rhizobium leguminosarum]MBY5363524.1 hypothetical protein [Rhizobium leguminosarum]
MIVTIPHQSHFPDIGDQEIASLGVPFAFVSVFDHWLTEAECMATNLFTYRNAFKANQLQDYLAGERKFLALYNHLGNAGTIVNCPGVLRSINSDSSEFQRILRSSLREALLMDIYLEGYGVRILGNFDRTDVIIADTREQLDVLEAEIAKFGLHMLRK